MSVAVAQSATSSTYITNTRTATLASSTKKDNTIVVLVYNHTNNTALSTMQDGAGNNLDLLGSIGTAGSRMIYMYAMPAQASQNLNFTATLTGAVLGLDVFELQGALIGTLGTPTSYYGSIGTAQAAAQAAPGDFNATPVAPLVTTTTTGDLILTGLVSPTAMGSPTGWSIGDTSGTATYTFDYYIPATGTSIFSMSGHETSPSVGNHRPYLTATGGTARATSIVTAVFTAASGGGANGFFGF